MAELGRYFCAKETFESQLPRFVRSALHFFDENRQFFQLYQAASQGISKGGARRTRRYDEYFTRLTSWVTRAMNAGEVRPLDPERVSLFFTEALTAVIRQRLVQDQPPPVDDDTE